ISGTMQITDRASKPMRTNRAMIHYARHGRSHLSRIRIADKGAARWISFSRPFSISHTLPRKPLPETGRYLKGAEAKILLPNTHRDSPPFSGVNSSTPLSGCHGQNGHEGHSTRVLAKTGHAFNSTATTDEGNTARSRRIWLTSFPVLELVIPRLGNRSRPDSWVDKEADRASGDGAVGAGSGAESRERSGGPGLPISDWPTHP